MRLNSLACLITAALMILSCTKSTTIIDSSNACTPYGSSGQNYQYPSGAANSMPVTIGCGYPNEPCVAVKICMPGTDPTVAANCQIIDHILLDTGSYGLRLFTCAVSLSLPHEQDPNTPGNELAECVEYADGTSDWGPVALADIYLGQQTTSTGGSSTGTPIQIIDPNYAATFIGGGSCGTPEYSPAASGFNGIMGIGLFQNDCPGCVGTNNINSVPFYATCTGGNCTVPTGANRFLAAKQVTNPIAQLTSNNNGTILEIDSVGGPTAIPSGTSGVGGTLIFGIDSGQSNNVTSSSPGGLCQTEYQADSSAGTFWAEYKSQTLQDSFVDSGSNLWDFPDAGLTQCGGDLAGDDIYCVSSPGDSLTVAPYTGIDVSTGASINFTIGDGSTIENGNTAYNEIGAYFAGIQQTFTPESFDFGLPFYFGRKICTGIKGTGTTSRGWAGPYWAW